MKARKAEQASTKPKLPPTDRLDAQQTGNSDTEMYISNKVTTLLTSFNSGCGREPFVGRESFSWMLTVSFWQLAVSKCARLCQKR